MPLASIPEAIDEIKQGRMVLVVDDEDRENEATWSWRPSTSPRRRSTSWLARRAG
jgi:3,4-dihydroxy-2-butanone 4-phosphate synthase